MRDSSKALQSASADFGQSVAVSALTFLAADAERLHRFLDITGLGSAQSSKRGAGSGVLRFSA